MTNFIKISGMGAVSSCGMGAGRIAQDLKAGRPSAARLSAFPVPFADEIKVNQFPWSLPESGSERTDEAVLAAVNEAIAEAGLPADGLRECAVILGSSGFIFEAESLYRRQRSLGITEPAPLSGRGAGRVASRIAVRLGIRGPVLTVTTACTSSANALLLAGTMIRRGEVKRAIVIGAELLNAFTLGGFYSLMLLSPEGCRPFDAKRRGIHLGEAAAALVLEAADSIDGPGAYLSGWANNCDTHNVISTSLDGRVVAEVMRAAILSAEIAPSDISAIKAHGTGSLDNDASEAAAMRLVFADGEEAAMPPFTGLKGCIGHTLGACGAIETAAFFNCLRDGFIPAATGFAEIDPAIGIAPLSAPRDAGNSSGCYMLNFFGFGGNNTSLVFKFVR